MAKTEKIKLINYSNKPLLLSLEPWGEDYTLREKEEVEIIAEDCGADFHFEVVYETDYIAVYPGGSGNEYPRVFSNGVELDCGYNRELSPVDARQDAILEADELE